MAFKRKNGDSKVMHLPVKPSTDFSEGDLVTYNASGKLIKASNGDNNRDILGVIREDISSTDDDYADDRNVPVEVPVDTYTVWEADVNSSLTASDRGKYLDLNNAGELDQSGTTNKYALVVKDIDSTTAEVILNIGPHSNSA